MNTWYPSSPKSLSGSGMDYQSPKDSKKYEKYKHKHWLELYFPENPLIIFIFFLSIYFISKKKKIDWKYTDSLKTSPLAFDVWEMSSAETLFATSHVVALDYFSNPWWILHIFSWSCFFNPNRREVLWCLNKKSLGNNSTISFSMLLAVYKTCCIYFGYGQ